LSGLGLSTLQISIDALNTDLIDKMTRRRGYGQRILRTLDHLGEAGVRVRTNTVITPHNVRNAIELARYLAEMPNVFKSHFTCYARSLYHHSEDLFCSGEELSRFEEELNRVREEHPGKAISFSGGTVDPYRGDADARALAFRNRALCTANRRGMVVLPDGRVTVCEELYLHESFVIGDLKEQTLMEVWNSPKAKEVARPIQSLVPDGVCRTCEDFERCHQGLGRCFRDALKAYGLDRPHWPDPRCPRAPVGNRMV
jgi:radical SAM protein with 4Fe4S-binding SPASM domain